MGAKTRKFTREVGWALIGQAALLSAAVIIAIAVVRAVA